MSLTTAIVLDNKLHIGSLQKESSPKTRAYWTDVVNGVAILDPEKIAAQLDQAKAKVQATKADNKSVLVVCDKVAYTDELQALADAHGFHYLNDKVPGGFLTNFETLTSKIKDLNQKVAFEESEEFAKLTKKEQVMHKRSVKKIKRVYGGVAKLTKKPDLVIVVDGATMTNFLHEVKKEKIENIVLASTDFSQRWDESALVLANMKSYQSLDFIISYLFSK